MAFNKSVFVQSLNLLRQEREIKLNAYIGSDRGRAAGLLAAAGVARSTRNRFLSLLSAPSSKTLRQIAAAFGLGGDEAAAFYALFSPDVIEAGPLRDYVAGRLEGLDRGGFCIDYQLSDDELSPFFASDGARRQRTSQQTLLKLCIAFNLSRHGGEDMLGRVSCVFATLVDLVCLGCLVNGIYDVDDVFGAYELCFGEGGKNLYK